MTMAAEQHTLLAGGASAPFTPPDVAGLLIWLKADGLTGLANNDPVSSFTDFSGNANHAANTLTKRPLYITNVLNGLPVVRFDGVNDVLLFPSMAANSFGTAVFVAKSSSTASTKKLLATVASGTITGIYHGGADTTKWGTRNGAGSYFYFGDISTSAFQVLSTQNGFSSNYTWALGGRDGADFFPGDLAEFIIYDSVISAPNLALVQGYLASKYAL